MKRKTKMLLAAILILLTAPCVIGTLTIGLSNDFISGFKIGFFLDALLLFASLFIAAITYLLDELL